MATQLDTTFDWNWAEQEEARAEQEAAMAAALVDRPYLPLLVRAKEERFEGAVERERPQPEWRTPNGVPGLPAGLSFAACCLLNPDHAQGQAWLRWGLGWPLSAEGEAQLMRGLELLSASLGPLLRVEPAAMDFAIQALATAEHASLAPWLNAALVRLFQPSDDHLATPSDAGFSPCCDLLLRSGALPHARDEQGNSPLSGINVLLSEAELGMDDLQRMDDLLACAQTLVSAGAHPDSARVEPPLRSLVRNSKLRDMLLAKQESLALEASLCCRPENSPSELDVPPTRDRRRL